MNDIVLGAQKQVNNQPKSPEKRVCTWLRKRIGPYWGEDIKGRIRQVSERQIVAMYRALRDDEPVRRPARLSNAVMLDHFVGKYNVYVRSDGRKTVTETLVQIDIDVHKTGSTDGALECVHWLRDHHFPGLYFEPSTRRKGIHAYPVIRKGDENELGLERSLISLERWLRHQHKLHGWDIEMIEVKGFPAVHNWGGPLHDLLGVRLGPLMKLPAEAMLRPEELMNTTVVTIPEIERRYVEMLGGPAIEGEQTHTLPSSYSDPIRTPFPGFGPVVVDELPVPSVGYSMRDREWPMWCEQRASHGLQDGDDLGVVVCNLAVFIYWVERFKEYDHRELTELFMGWLESKSNGEVERLERGRVKEVEQQVKRAVKWAMKPKCARTMELMAIMRGKRERGEYRKVIEIVPMLGGPAIEGEQTHTLPSSYSDPIRNDNSPTPFDEELAQIAKSSQMRRRDGEYPFVSFARRFLNRLWAHEGTRRIRRDDLLTLMDAPNKDRLRDYLGHLAEARLIHDYEKTSIANTVPSKYTLSRRVKNAYEERYEAQQVLRVG